MSDTPTSGPEDQPAASAAESPAEPVPAATPAEPAPAPVPAPLKPKRTVSLMVAALGAALLLVVGGVGGYFIGNAGDGRDGPRPGHSKAEFGRGGPGFGPWGDFERRGGPDGPVERGQRRGPKAPASPPTTSSPSSTAPTTTG